MMIWIYTSRQEIIISGCLDVIVAYEKKLTEANLRITTLKAMLMVCKDRAALLSILEFF